MKKCLAKDWRYRYVLKVIRVAYGRREKRKFVYSPGSATQRREHLTIISESSSSLSYKLRQCECY